MKTAVGKGEHRGRKQYSRAPAPAHWTVLGLSSTAVYTLCTLVEFYMAAHAFFDGLIICVHFTSGIAAAAGSQLSMLLQL